MLREYASFRLHVPSDLSAIDPMPKFSFQSVMLEAGAKGAEQALVHRLMLPR